MPDITKVLTNLKLAIGGTFVQALVDLTPNTWDNELKDKFVAALDIALKEFSIVQSNLNIDGSINVPSLILQLERLTKVDRDSFYIKVKALLLKYLHDGKLTQAEYDLFAQGDYTISIAA